MTQVSRGNFISLSSNEVSCQYSWLGSVGKMPRSYSEKHASEVCELLIANGAKINEGNAKGQTPLDEALANGRKKTAEILRKHGGKMGEELKAKKTK